MIVTTTEGVPGFDLEILGITTGSTVRAKHLGKDITAFLKGLVGGEIEEYTEMMKDAREEALNRMINEASTMGADAVVNVRFASAQTVAGAAEIMAYGTAVKLRRA